MKRLLKQTAFVLAAALGLVVFGVWNLLIAIIEAMPSWRVYMCYEWREIRKVWRGL